LQIKIVRQTKLKNPLRNRYSLILSGFIIGSSPTLFFLLIEGELNILVILGALLMVISSALGLGLNSWWNATGQNGRKISRTRKARLLFFGITLASFLFAFVDICRYFFANSNTIVLYQSYPWVTIGGIPFFSVLLSFATGGLFTVLERLLEIKEKNDI
jgi:hypothetical protein